MNGVMEVELQADTEWLSRKIAEDQDEFISLKEVELGLSNQDGEELSIEKKFNNQVGSFFNLR